jgi:hypothetical protein
MRRFGSIGMLALLALLASCELPELTLVGWGNINFDATIRGSSDNFTVSHPATGDYRILWTDDTATTAADSIVEVSPISSGDVTAVWTGASGDNLAILLYNTAGAAADAAFSFTVYQW